MIIAEADNTRHMSGTDNYHNFHFCREKPDQKPPVFLFVK